MKVTTNSAEQAFLSPNHVDSEESRKKRAEEFFALQRTVAEFEDQLDLLIELTEQDIKDREELEEELFHLKEIQQLQDEENRSIAMTNEQIQHEHLLRQQNEEYLKKMDEFLKSVAESLHAVEERIRKIDSELQVFNAIYLKSAQELFSKTDKLIDNLPVREFTYHGGQVFNLKDHIKTIMKDVYQAFLADQKRQPHEYISLVKKAIEQSADTFVEKMNIAKPEDKAMIHQQVRSFTDLCAGRIEGQLKQEEPHIINMQKMRETIALAEQAKKSEEAEKTNLENIQKTFSQAKSDVFHNDLPAEKQNKILHDAMTLADQSCSSGKSEEMEIFKLLASMSKDLQAQGESLGAEGVKFTELAGLSASDNDEHNKLQNP